MARKNRPLPIGSVVLLKGADTKMMILGYLKYGPFNRTDIYDYAACLYPQALAARYQLQADPELPGWALLEQAGRQRGMLVSGGDVDTGRMARVLLDEFRGGKLGRFTLELPQED